MLIERWNRTWSVLEFDPPPGVGERVLQAYSEPHRAYHTTQHLEECFAHLQDCSIQPLDQGCLELAIWFHDSIYDTHSGENEAQSAAQARRELGVLPASSLDRIEQLILVTQHNAAPACPDQALLLDIDLSVLGASKARFEEYETQIRQEYDWVPEEAYRGARIQILQEFQARQPLFLTPHFRERLEAQAHRNLERSIGSLAP